MGNEDKGNYKFYLTDVNFGDGFFKLTGGYEIKFEANPNAPKDIEGGYTLTVNGRTVTLSDGKDKVSVTCHVDDNFDVGEGVRQCFEKLKKAREEIKVGDMVEVVDNLESYTTNTAFFINNNVPIKYCVNYRYGVCAENSARGKVVFIKGKMVVIEASFNDTDGFPTSDAIYLIHLNGLRKVVN